VSRQKTSGDVPYTISYEYDSSGNRTSETHPAPHGSGVTTVTTYFEYDKNGRLVKTTYPDNTTTETEYDSLGKATGRKDQKDRWTYTTYDNTGRTTDVLQPDGSSISNNYTDEGRLTWVDSKDRSSILKLTTKHSYDSSGRRTGTHYLQSPETSSTTYDSQGRVLTETDESGVTTSYSYNQDGTKSSMSRGSYSATYMYDANGNQTVVTDTNGSKHTDYDRLNRPVKIYLTNDITKYKEIKYDEAGRRTEVIDENLKSTKYNYDCAGRLVSVEDHDGNFTYYAYDTSGNMITQTDARGNATTYEYDKMSRRTKRTLPGDTVYEQYWYDAAGNITSKRNFNGTTIAYDVDSITDRLNSKTSGSWKISYTYDDSNRVSGAMYTSGLTGATSHSTTFTYDSRDRMRTKTSPEGIITYNINTKGRLDNISSANVNGIDIGYRYDGDARLKYVDDKPSAATQTTTYEYDSIGNLDTMAYPNGIKHDWDYDADNRLNKINITNSSDEIVKRFIYTLADTGNRTACTELDYGGAVPAPGRVAAWEYDNMYRLTSETISNDPDVNGEVTYEYDAVGNRETRTSTLAPVSVQSFNYDNNDRISGYGFDDMGSTTSAPGNWIYAYDPEGRLLTATDGTKTVNYQYDGMGNRVGKTVDGVETRYLVDSSNPTGYSQTLEEQDSAGNVIKRYTYGLDLVCVNEYTGGGWNTSYYGYDGMGSVRQLFDSSGNITGKYTYDAFGLELANTASSSNPYRFHGEFYDRDIDLYYLRARFMKPDIGRFWNMDSHEGISENPMTIHKYTFTHNNAVNGIDPSGNFTLVEGMIVVGVLGIVCATVYDMLYSYELVFDEVVNGPVIKDKAKGFFKPYKLKIKGKKAEERFFVVQFVKGYMAINGRNLLLGVHRGKKGVTANYSSFVVDTVYGNTPEYSHLKKSRYSIMLEDSPGKHTALNSGENYVANADFIVAVYNKSAKSNLSLNSTWSPTHKDLLGYHEWSFKDSYIVP